MLALKNPKPLFEFDTVEQLSAGQHVTFGSYEQDGNTANGSEPIEWIVLDKKSDKVLLLSDKLLDYVQYNEQKVQITWEDCSLRKWMNDNFMDAAFDESEQDKITLSKNINSSNDEYKTTGGNSTLDNIFALSVDEVNLYFSSDKSMIAYTTEFARQKCYASSDGSDYWWLRSPGKSGEYAADVYENGGIVVMGNSVDLNTVAIRPAMWVQID